MQFIMDSLEVNEKGHLSMSKCDLCDIASEFGTPTYVLDEATIRKNCRAYVESIEKYYGGNGRAIYASKALSCKYMYKLINEENMGVDVVSGGEIFAALAAGFLAEKIYFHGNNKSYDELEYALKSNVGRIMVDNMTELKMIDEISGALNICANVIIRITPGIDASTHKAVLTGLVDSKFGSSMETGVADEIVGAAVNCKNINICGFHCHIGSQIFDIAPFELAAQKMMSFLSDMKEKYGIVCEELDLGGGFGVKYLPQDKPVDYGEYMKAVSVIVKREAAERNLKLPFIIVEPGRSIVAEAGLTLYTVGSVKEIPDIRTYIMVDGGMADNPRYILYEADYTAVSVDRPEAPRDRFVTIAGKCCESGDMIGENMPLCEVNTGDKIAILSTGAYNYSMSSNYNRLPKPPIVVVADGKPKLVVRRETYADMLSCDIF